MSIFFRKTNPAVPSYGILWKPMFIQQTEANCLLWHNGVISSDWFCTWYDCNVHNVITISVSSILAISSSTISGRVKSNSCVMWGFWSENWMAALVSLTTTAWFIICLLVVVVWSYICVTRVPSGNVSLHGMQSNIGHCVSTMLTSKFVTIMQLKYKLRRKIISYYYYYTIVNTQLIGNNYYLIIYSFRVRR